MVQNSGGDDSETAPSVPDDMYHRRIYYNHTIGRAVTDCFPYPSTRDTLARGELKIQPDYLELNVERGSYGERSVHNIYGQFEGNKYVGKTLKAALIRAIVG
jgi:hypothetical protein